MRHLLALAAVCSLLPLVSGGEALAQPGINLPGSPYLPSGNPPVTSTLSAAGVSSTFTPLTGRTYYIQLSGTASATCYLERQLDASTWATFTVNSNGTTTTLHEYTYSSTEISDDEVSDQVAVPVRLDCGVVNGSFTSGSLTVRFSQ